MASNNNDDSLDLYWEDFTPQKWDPEKFALTLALEYIRNDPFYLGLFVGHEELNHPRQHLVMGPDGSNTKRIDFMPHLSEAVVITHAGLFTNLERFAGPIIIVDLVCPSTTIGPGDTVSFLPGTISFKGLPILEIASTVF